MRKKVINPVEVETLHLPGRDLSWIVTPELTGIEKLSIAIMNCPPRSVVRPLHSHKDTEEVILILQGQGKAWIDGEIVPFQKGDAVIFHSNSKHQVMNTGGETLITASIFSPPTNPDSYVIYPDDMFLELYE